MPQITTRLPALATLAFTLTVPLAAQTPLSGNVLVANQQSATASIVNLATRAVTTVAVGDGPHEAMISPDGRWGVVTVYGVRGAPGNQLAVIDLTQPTVVRMIDLGQYTRPHGLQFVAGSSSRVALTSEATQNVVLVDIAAGRVLSAIPTQHRGSHMLGIPADGARIYTANMPDGGISELDPARGVFVRDLAVAAATEGVAVTPDGGTVWVGSNTEGTVSVVDTRSWAIVATLRGLGMPYRIGTSPDSRRAVVVDATGNRVIVADVATRAVLGDIALAGSPRGVMIAPDNRTAFVTLGPENQMVVVDIESRQVLWQTEVGTAPDGVGYGRPPR